MIAETGEIEQDEQKGKGKRQQITPCQYRYLVVFPVTNFSKELYTKIPVDHVGFMSAVGFYTETNALTIDPTWNETLTYNCELKLKLFIFLKLTKDSIPSSLSKHGTCEDYILTRQKCVSLPSHISSCGYENVLYGYATRL